MAAVNKKVIILLADARLRGIIERTSEENGWEVELAERPLDAERKAVTFHPGIVFADVAALDDVAAALKHWRSLPTLHRAKIVLYFGKVSSESMKAALKAGADTAVVRGTLSPHEIVKTFERLLFPS